MPASATTPVRVGDAERMQAASQLAEHYSAGRLTEAELDERLDRAMWATTRDDLAALLADLPARSPQEAERQPRRTAGKPAGGLLRRLAVLAVIMIAAAVTIHVLTHSVVAWLVLALVAILWLRRAVRGGRRSG